MAETTTPAPVHVGKPLDRVDGRLKVTGAATYAADAPLQGTVVACVVQSTVARGQVRAIDTAAAEKAPGVLAVLTPLNLPKLVPMTLPKPDFAGGGVPAEMRLPLSDMRIHYGGQHVAVVVADTAERARAAARLVKVDYDAQPPVLGLDNPAAKTEMPEKSFGEEAQVKRGDPDAALAAPGLTVVRQTYTTPVETHNPMEMSATTAHWDAAGRLTVHDSTQFVTGTRAVLAEALGLPREHVRVLCPFIGGGFGCKGFQWPHTLLAAAAAKVVGRPVRLVLSRPQMFTSVGHRPPTRQEMALAATPDGKLAAVRHVTTMHGSQVGEHVEACGLATSRILYAAPAADIRHVVKKVDVNTPTPMRAPGECPGSFALECAMDELAYALKLDPVELRLRNHADVHPQTGKPWSSKHLKECYQLAADRFGWAKRDPKPGAMRDGGSLVGYGMATATYPGYRFPAVARLRLVLGPGGVVRGIGSCAAHDLGTGAYTVFTQTTADALGLPPDRVTFELGDTALPPGPVAGGSNTTASVSEAIAGATAALKANLAKLIARDPRSALAGVPADKLVFRNGAVAATNAPDKSVLLTDLLAAANVNSVEGTSAMPTGNADPNKAGSQGTSGGGDSGQGGGGGGGGGKPPPGPAGYVDPYTAAQKEFAFQSFGCHFVEVRIDPRLATVRVARVVSAMDVGRVLNPKTAASQVRGGVIMGIGMALLEATEYDPTSGRPVNANLADYPVCTNADVRQIETIFTDHPDPHINALGCRGVGEIGITGVAAAVANAVFHATGKRVRDLPISLERLL